MEVVRTPEGFVDLDLNPYLGRTVRLTDEAYTVGLTDRFILITSTDANQYAITFPAVGRPGQTIDLYMPVNPTGAGSFVTVTLGAQQQFVFDRIRHLTAFFNNITNTWVLLTTSGTETQHLNVGNIGAPAVGVATVPTPAALSFFGQMNVSRPKRIRVCHMHLIEDATGGDLTIELYRRRSGVFTLLGTISYTAPTSDFITAALVPVGDLANVANEDYIYAQALVVTAVGNGADGLTVDVHFDDLPVLA